MERVSARLDSVLDPLSIGLDPRWQVDPANGMLKIFCWLRMQWTDRRLSWDPAEYGGVQHFYAAAAGVTAPEETDVWLPDITMYNSHEAMSDTLEKQLAMVDSNGVVWWSRPGMLEVMCKFAGLVNFPHDEISCPIDLGGFAISGAQQDIVMMDDGVTFYEGNQSRLYSHGSSYTQWSVTDQSAWIGNLTYPCCPEEVWPTMHIYLSLKRNGGLFYFTTLYFPSVTTSVLAMGVFFLSPEVGERLGYGITLVLAMQVGVLLTKEMVPVCRETLYIDVFREARAIRTPARGRVQA